MALRKANSSVHTSDMAKEDKDKMIFPEDGTKITEDNDLFPVSEVRA